MADKKATPPKPVSADVHPEITQFPELTPGRERWRRFWRAVARLFVRLFGRVQIEGQKNFPAEGPVIVVSNHLGDVDMVLGLTFTPRTLEYMVKSELNYFPILGAILRSYGVIMIHRGRADRRALRAALEALSEGRPLAIAPEGRESLSGELEEGTQGAAFLALRAKAPILPVTFTGTENTALFRNIKRLRRTPMTVTIGKPFKLESGPNRKENLARGTEQIMRTLARQLPPEYRGVYQNGLESNDERG